MGLARGATERDGPAVMKPIVYAAGPIAGQSYEGAIEWRFQLQELLMECDVRSPMRGKESLKNRATMPYVVEPDQSNHGVDTQHAIVIRDHWDVQNCDILVVNFAPATKVSVGSCFELAWALAYRKPAVVIMGENGLHDHPFIQEAAYVVVPDLETVALIVRQLLNLADGGREHQR